MALFPLSGLILTDNNGNGVAGGKLFVYEAGTTTPIDTFTDVTYTTPASNPRVLDSAGRCPVTYWPPDSYKVVFQSADEATTYFTIDNWVVDDPATASAVPAETITSNTSVDTDDLDRIFYGNTASGDITLTADSETLGSGFIIHAKKSSSDTNDLIVSGTGVQVIDGNATFTLAAQYDSATFISLGATGWAVLAQTLDTATLVSDNAIQRIQVALQCGQFRYASATTCTLFPHDGNYINFPNGDLIAIGASGISTVFNSATINGTAAQTLSANATYYAYVYNNAGTLVIDWSTTGPAWDSATGIRIKTGDETRVLVGLARTNSSSQFDDSATKRNVISWRNRKSVHMANKFTTTRAYASASWGEINTEIRIEFVTWGDAVGLSFNAVVDSIDTGGPQNYSAAVTLDGSTSPTSRGAMSDVDVAGDMGMNATYWATPSVGHHYATVIAQSLNTDSLNFLSDTYISAVVV